MSERNVMNADNGGPPNRPFRTAAGRGLLFIPAIFLAGLVGYSLIFGEDPSGGFGPRTDFYLYFLPLTDLGFEMMARGEPPLWNPYIFCGMPLVSSIELGFFYPPNWIHFILPAHIGFNLLTVFHIILAACATYLYCSNRKMVPGACLLAAMCYGFSGPLALHLWSGHMATVYSMAWFPVIMLCVDKLLEASTLTRVLALSWVSAFQFLAGFPMYTLVSGLIVLAYLPVIGPVSGVGWGKGEKWRFLLLLTGAGILYLLLISVQLIPTLEFIQHSHRGVLDYRTATTASFPIQNLITFLSPKFFGDGITTPYRGEFFLWEGMGYCGVAALVFCILSLLDYRNRFVVFWGFVLLLTVGISLGKYSWVYDLAYITVPGLNIFRGVGKLIIFSVFSIAVLAGNGMDRLLDRDWRASDKKLQRLLYGISGFGLVGLGFCGWGLYAMEPLSTHSAAALFWGFLTTLLLGIAVLRFRFTLLSGFRVLPLIILTIMGIELFHHNFQYFQKSKSLPLSTLNTAAASLLTSDRSHWRISAVVSSLEFLNRFVPERFYDVGGYENSILTRYDAFLNRLFGGRSSWGNIHLQVPYNEAVYDMLNVKYVIYEPGPAGLKATGDRSAQGTDVVDYRIRTRKDVPGRAYISHRAVYVDSFREALHRLPEVTAPGSQADLVVESGAVLETEPVSENEKSMERAMIVSYTPNTMTIEAHLAKPGFLVVSDIFYPGWKARVGEEAAPVLAANVCLKAIHLGAGTHNVRLEFRPVSFLLGCLFTGLALVVSLAVLIFKSTEHKKSRRK